MRPQTFLMTNDGSSRPARLHADTISRLFIPWADSHPHLNYQEEDKRKDERRKELGETRGGSIQQREWGGERGDVGWAGIANVWSLLSSRH